MRNIIYVIAAIAVVSSCGLDVDVYDQLTPYNALNTEDDVKAAVTGIYHELRGGGWNAYNCAWGSLLTMQVGCTDECDCNWNWDVQMDFLWKAETADMGIFYNEMMPAVTKATSLIERLKPVRISAPFKRQCTAELRCLRAIWAYDLYDLYGPVTIVSDPGIALDPGAADAWQPERPSVEWYVGFVARELKECQEHLRKASELSSSEYGRMTKGIAQMYLLKLFLHEAGQEMHYRSGNKDKAKIWWERVDSITSVMQRENQYSLQKDYMSIWSPSNQRNSEVIFPVPNFPVGGLGNVFLAHALPADYVSRDGVPLTRWGGFLVPWDFYDSYDPKDKRRNALLASYWNGRKVVDLRKEYVGKPGAVPMKYQENPNTTGQWDASEYVINRYAEVILARAEALNELYGPVDEAKQLLHSIRSRAFDNYEGSGYQKEIDAIGDKDVFRDIILAERGWEFCWEGMRRPDLIRHGKLISNARERGKVMAEEKHILYAIPQSAIYENPNIKNNSGF